MNNEVSDFILDQRLATDCVRLGDLPLCQVLLMNDEQYPWLILVPRRAGITEIHHLSDCDQQTLMKESSQLANILCDLFSPKKMNVAALGNVVSQLHMHHVVRYEHDNAWPKPIWGANPVKPYAEKRLAEVCDSLISALSAEMDFKPTAF